MPMPTVEQTNQRHTAPHLRWFLLLDALIVLTVGFAAEVFWESDSPAPLANWVSGFPHSDQVARASGFCAAALLVMAVHGFIRFLLDDDTHAGFATGLVLPVIVLWDWRSLVPILVMVFVGAAISRGRHIGERGAALATICVLMFPTAATLLSLIFIDWRFNS